MKLFYELRIITLAPTQYHTVHPWPVALALALQAALIALVATALRLEYAIRVVATAGRLAGRVIWDDLAYLVSFAADGKANPAPTTTYSGPKGGEGIKKAASTRWESRG